MTASKKSIRKKYPPAPKAKAAAPADGRKKAGQTQRKDEKPVKFALGRRSKKPSTGKLRILPRPLHARLQARREARRAKTKLIDVPNSFRLFASACRTVCACWRPLLVLLVVYAILNIIFVRQFNFTDVRALQSSLGNLFNGSAQKLGTGFSAFTYLLGNDATSNGNGGYQFVLLVVMSLAMIWILRQHAAGVKKIRVRDAFYGGMYPLVPFVLVLCLLILELAPMLAGVSLYAVVLANSITVNALELTVATVIFALLVLWSLYMICSSSFSLYVATLPEMRPVKALRTGRELVRFRRFVLIRKILFGCSALLVLLGIIVIPLAIVLPGIVSWIFFGLTLIMFPFFHSYMYTLYRALL